MDGGGYALKGGEGARINFRGTRIVAKVSGKNSEGAYSLFEMTHPANVGPALHVHPKAPEAYYVIEGESAVRYGDRTVLAKADDFVFIPKGVPHNYQSGPAGGKVLVISPAGLEGYFEQVADIIKEGSITWQTELEIAKKYGQEFLDGLRHWGQ